MILKIIHFIIALTLISMYLGILFLTLEVWFYFGLVLISALISQYLYYKEQVKDKEFIKQFYLKLNLN